MGGGFLCCLCASGGGYSLIHASSKGCECTESSQYGECLCGQGGNRYSTQKNYTAGDFLSHFFDHTSLRSFQ